MALFAILQLSSCLNEDNKIPPNCYDGILNNGEERIDCGGVNCPPCDPCTNGVWEPELGEQWVDCGGECDPCDVHFNGQLDPGEDGIDCGGTTGVDCAELCGDGLLNGFEEGIDCGGPDCDDCPSCDDEILNQDEIGIDCGGENCDPCTTDGDCTNGIIDGDELYIDCGGTHCPECNSLINWKVGPTQASSDFSVSCELVGTSIMGSGASSTAPGVLTFLLPEPELFGWQNDATIDLNMEDFPDGYVNYVTGDGTTYSTEFENASATFNIIYVDAVPGGVVVGTFSAQLRAEDESVINLTQGNFLLVIAP